MKISRSALLLAATSPLIFAHCAAAQTMPADAATPAVAASPGTADMGRQLDAQTVVLRVQPPVGARYLVKQFSRFEMQQPKNPGSPAGTSVDIVKATLDMEVTGRDALGGTTMKLTYREFSMNGFDSISDNNMTDEGRKTMKQRRSQLSADLIGQSFSLKIAPDCQIWSAIVPQKVGSIFVAVPNSSLSPQTATFIAQRVNNREKQHGAIALLPVVPIRVGDSWNTTVPGLLISNFPMALRGQRTLKGLRNGVALVAESGQITASLEPFDSTKMDGTLTGISRIDIASGLPLETNLTARVNAEMVGLGDNKFETYKFSTVSTDRMIIEPR